MKWSVVVGFLVVCLARYNEGGALKCTPGSADSSCTTEKEEKGPSTEISKEDPAVLEIVKTEAECLAGSEWDSNCHYCRCSDTGIAECLKLNNCDTGLFTEPIKCKPNTTFQRDCNTCMCLENGLGLCTLEFCPASIIPKKSELKSGKECLPGSTWTSQCNQCICSADGYSSCTEIYCVDHETELPMHCAPSSVWKNECNACWCTTEGQAMCTRMECVNFESEPVEKIDDQNVQPEKNLLKPISHRALKRSVCKPNQEFQSECNACKCAADGQSYTCTHNECLDKDMDKEVEVFMENEGVDHIEKHSVCKPRDTFYVGCNTCHCNAYGTDYTCTNKPCPLPEDVELFHELKAMKSSIKTNATKIVCEANRMFIKDCNTCWCNEDGTGFFCTRKVCVQELPEEPSIEDVKPENLRTVKKECRPDEVFELDCNMCRCNGDGKSFSCTRRARLNQIEDVKNVSLPRKVRALPSPQEPPKICKPGQEFRMDCNKCLCDNEGQDFSCTRNDCVAVNRRRKREISEKVPSQCVPGSVFDRECNVCRCTQDGQYATCTLKRCQQKDNIKEDHSTETDQGSGFRCNAGEQFKQDCNDCTCSADGKSVFCTLRLCDEELTPSI